MDERQRWLFGIGALLALALVLFVLVVLLNTSTILTGAVLLIFQIAISAIVIILALGIAFWVLGFVFQAIGDSEDRIRANLEAVQKTLLRATEKFGADVLSFITGILAFLIQEMVSTYPKVYKISISLLFAMNFFLASQLIGSKRKFEVVLGIFFFIAPVASFVAAFLILLPEKQISQWFNQRSAGELVLMSFVVLSALLTFTFAFLKSRGA